MGPPSLPSPLPTWHLRVTRALKAFPHVGLSTSRRPEGLSGKPRLGETKRPAQPRGPGVHWGPGDRGTFFASGRSRLVLPYCLVEAERGLVKTPLWAVDLVLDPCSPGGPQLGPHGDRWSPAEGGRRAPRLPSQCSAGGWQGAVPTLLGGALRRLMWVWAHFRLGEAVTSGRGRTLSGSEVWH